MKYIYLILLFPVISFCQSGISISGQSQFGFGEELMPLNNETFEPVLFKNREYAITLSIMRGRKLIIGTFWLHLNVTYQTSNTSYDFIKNTLNENNYNLISRRLTPSAELRYVIIQSGNAFLYSSIGSYAVLENLSVEQESETDLDLIVHKYNGIIPFIRSGMQLDFGRFFINPFLSYDIGIMDFNSFTSLSQSDFKNALDNASLRTGIKFGIMF